MERGGGMRTIEEIFFLYANDVFRYVNSYVRNKYIAEDILQDTFYKAYIALDAYNGENVKAWLFLIAKRTIIDYYRKQKRIEYTSEELINNRILDNDLQKKYEYKEEIEKIVGIIKSLPAKQQKAIVLKDFKDFTYDEGARAMGMKVSTFKTLVFRARQKIREKMRGDHRQ